MVAAPTQEIGYMNAFWSILEHESTPELMWPLSVGVYRRMYRQDAQVQSVIRAVTLPIRRTPWRIEPNGARDEVVEHVADDLNLPIVGEGRRPVRRTRDRFSWKEHLRLALLQLVYGHSIFEQQYDIRNASPGGTHLKKLAWRPPVTIQEFKVARDGGLDAVLQYGSDKPMPIGRLVAYVNEREGANWQGNSLLRSCYKNWLIKDDLLRTDSQTIRRNGMGVPTYTGYEGEGKVDPGHAKGLAVARSYRAGETAAASIPYGAKLDLKGVEGDLPQALPSIRYHDEQIARAVLAHFLNLGTQTGSWALGSTFADFFTLGLQTVADDVADVGNQHIVEDIVDLNWGPDEPAPLIVCDEIGSRQMLTAAALKMLIEAGAFAMDPELEAALRQQYGLPPRDPNAPRPEQQDPPETPDDPEEGSGDA